MIEVGKTQKLEVNKKIELGLELKDPRSGDVVLLPKAHISRELDLGEEVSAFVYIDTSSKEKTATLLQPVANVGEFAYLIKKHTSTRLRESDTIF